MIEAIIDRWRKKRDPDWDGDIGQDQRTALRFVAWIDGHPERYEAVLDALSDPGQDWVWDVAREVASRGHFAAAEEIARGFAAVADPGQYLSELAIGLADGGALEEARRVATECIDLCRADAWPLINCGRALEAVGDFLGAESAYQQARKAEADNKHAIRESEERLDALKAAASQKGEAGHRG